jgi:hypothetical protein
MVEIWKKSFVLCEVDEINGTFFHYFRARIKNDKIEAMEKSAAQHMRTDFLKDQKIPEVFILEVQRRLEAEGFRKVAEVKL